MAKSKFIDVTLRFRDQMTGKMDVAIDKMTASQKRLNQVGGKLVKTGKSITNVGSTLTKGVTAPLVAAGAACVKTAAEFESSMSNVQAIAGASGEEMEQLKEKALEMGAKTKFSASESADAFSYMATAGWETSEMLDGIEGIMYLAGATGEDLAQTSDIVTDSLTAFGLTASDTNHFVDVLAQTANATNTDVSKMGETFKYVAPVAGALGYSIEDTSVAIGLMANQGIKASQAGTALRSLLTNLSKPTDAMQGAMDKLGISLTDSAGNMKSLDEVMQDLRQGFSGLSKAEKSNYAATIAGKNGMTGLLAIVNSTDEDFNSATESINNCTGAAKEMYDVATDNLEGSLTTLKSTIETISISIGDRLSPYVAKATAFIQKLADKFNSLSDEQLDTIIKMAGVAAAIGPVLLVIGKATTSIGKLLKNGKKIVKGIKAVRNSFDTVTSVIGILNPKLLLVIGIVAAVAAVAFVIYKNWDKIKPLFEKVGEAFKKLGDGFKQIGERIKSDWNDIKQWWEGFCEKFKAKCDTIKEKWNALKDGFKQVGELIKSDWNNLKESWQSFCDKVKGKCDELKNKWEDFKNKVIAIFKIVKEAIKLWVDSIKENFEKFKKSIDRIEERIIGFTYNFLMKFKSLRQSVFTIVGNIKDTIDGIKKVFSGIITFITGTFTGNWRRAWQGVKDIFSGIFSTLSSALKAPLNAVIGLINSAIRKINTISFTVPDWVPGLGGKTFGASLNTIPYLYKGTNYFEGGTAVIHDKGAEIVDLPRGTRVIPHDKSINEAYKMGQSSKSGGTVNKNITVAKLADTIIVREEADIDKIAEKLAKKLEETDNDFDDVA